MVVICETVESKSQDSISVYLYVVDGDDRIPVVLGGRGVSELGERAGRNYELPVTMTLTRDEWRALQHGRSDSLHHGMVMR